MGLEVAGVEYIVKLGHTLSEFPTHDDNGTEIALKVCVNKKIAHFGTSYLNIVSINTPSTTHAM